MQNFNPETLREPDDGFDRVLRAELRWEAPTELTGRLLALVPGVLPVLAPQPPVRPKTWYSSLVLALTMLVIGISFAVAWQFYGLLGAELGLAGLWAQLQASFADGVQRVTTAMPAMGYLFALIDGVREQLHWLLIAVILWLALDGWSPRFARRRRPIS